MKKIPWIYALLSFFLGALIVGFTFKGWDWLPKENYRFNFDTLISFLGVVVSVVAILIVVRNTNRQITNQNKEMYRPYLILYRGSVHAHVQWNSGVCKIRCENAGYGICFNINTFYYNEFTAYNDAVEKQEFNIKITPNNSETEFNALLFYSDAFGNAYGSLITYDGREAKLYHQTSSDFKKYTKTINYIGILNEYKEKV